MNALATSIRRPPVPFNPHPDWPNGYFHVLDELGVERSQQSLYAFWVRRFFAMFKGRKRRRDLGATEIKRFLDALDQDEMVADWQRSQAEDALIIYYEQFRGIPLDDSEPDETSRKPRASARKPRAMPNKRRSERAPKRRGRRPDAREETDIPVSVPPPPTTPGARKADWNALEQAVREALRVGHYSRRTESSYVYWIRYFVRYHHDRRPSEMGETEIHHFLSHLACNKRVASSTQNQALNALVFL
jgi:hypothetical protein